MKSFVKYLVAFTFAAGAVGVAQASAEYRPDRCTDDHDHRSHSASYYDYYDEDKYYRAGEYRGQRASYDRRDRYDNQRGRYDRDRRGRRYEDRRPRSRVVNRQTYRTQYNARIVLVEEIYWTRSGREQLVCSVIVKGRDSYYVPQRRLRRIANRDCSRRARIQYLS